RGWHRVTFLFDAERTLVLIDENVAGRGAGVGALANVRLGAPQGPTAAPGAAPEAWIDDVRLFERVQDPQLPLNTQRSDLVRLAEGDELFGEVLGADRRAVVLSSRFGRRRIPWTELRGLEFGAGGGPPGEPVAGLVATIELAPVRGGDKIASD